MRRDSDVAACPNCGSPLGVGGCTYAFCQNHNGPTKSAAQGRPTLSAAEVWKAGHDLIVREGWQRTEQGFGWWWHPERQHEEVSFGDALEMEIDRVGIDTRMEPQL